MSDINDIYLASPLSELGDDDLLYVGADPGGTPADGAINKSDLFTQIDGEITGRIVLSDDSPIVYTADDTWTKPAGLHHIIVEVQSAGGGGGGCVAGTATNPGCGMSGGGGEYAKKRIDAADLGATETVTVGEGGAGGAAGTNNGATGETSSFGTHVDVIGGGGGNGDANAVTPPMTGVSAGGAGGTGGSGGDIHIPGSAGLSGVKWSNIYVVGSVGGASHLGAMARSTTGSDTDEDGIVGKPYGGGGTGARSTNNVGTNQAGGDGADGVVIVWEYIEA